MPSYDVDGFCVWRHSTSFFFFHAVSWIEVDVFLILRFNFTLFLCRLKFPFYSAARYNFFLSYLASVRQSKHAFFISVISFSEFEYSHKRRLLETKTVRFQPLATSQLFECKLGWFWHWLYHWLNESRGLVSITVKTFALMSNYCTSLMLLLLFEYSWIECMFCLLCLWV